MRPTRKFLLGAALALVSSSAWGFQEQQGAPAAADSPPPAADSKAPAGSGLGLEGADQTLPVPAGTEVRIPGLGKLGVLPKMDFGLELLYGASEPKQPDASKDPTSDDLTIRGTVKHKF